MEKLLHERLREPDTELCIGEMLELIVTGKTEDCTGRLCGQCIVDAMNSLADEIERTYVALPRDDKGVPVRGGDVFTDGVCEFSANYLVVDLNDQRRYWLFDDYGDDLTTEPFKRPTPKVCDADGVEIKVGDTVYIFDPYDMTVSEEPVTVKEVINDGVCHLIYTNEMGECGYGAGMLTHERPVFDAEGVRICKGDTVWHVRTGQKATVTTVYRDDQTRVEVEIAGRLMDYEPSDLTHREPDSLEKLRDFASEWSHPDNVSNSSAGDFRDAMQEVTDRLTALIERGV